MNKCSSNESYFAILFLGDFTRFFNWEERILIAVVVFPEIYYMR